MLLFECMKIIFMSLFQKLERRISSKKSHKFKRMDVSDFRFELKVLQSFKSQTPIDFKWKSLRS
ncbi:hypothetical protein LEP1GSC175_2690 [Leptospira santarosai str. HAI821]|nr:hypothetical protein LEP1GSC163_4015 [Leptospira santarosai str. CBC379]EMO33538.1 hypothetical protein LEP1GSC175_2690 [Leptospira santarosai str. HAI821]